MPFPIEFFKPQKKSDMYRILNKFNSKTVRADMLEVIQKHRNCPIKEAQDVKTLKESEVAEVLKRYE